MTFDFPPRLSSGVFRPVKIYKYLDKSRLSVDFVTHGHATRFRDAVMDTSLMGEFRPMPRVARVPTPIPHDALPAYVARMRRLLGRVRGFGRRARADTGVRPGGSVERDPSRHPGAGGALYRRLAMGVYFPDQLFLWGHLAALTGLWLHIRRRYDAVYTTSYPESAHLPGFLLHALGVPWVVDYRYGGPLWIKKLVGFQKSPWRERLDLAYQRTVMRWADRVITQSEPMRRDFCAAFGLDPAKVDVIPSGYDDEDFTRTMAGAAPFEKRPDEVHLLHVGVMEGTSPVERRQLLLALNQVADGLRELRRALVVHAVGKHLFDERLLQEVGFDYRFHGTVVHQHLPPFLASADGFLLSTITTTTGHDGVRGFIPGKVWEYLRAGKPIVMVGPKDEVWSIIDEAGVGVHMGLGGEPPLTAARLLVGLDATRSPHPKVRSYSWESRAHAMQHSLLQVISAAQPGPPGGQLRV